MGWRRAPVVASIALVTLVPLVALASVVWAAVPDLADPEARAAALASTASDAQLVPAVCSGRDPHEHVYKPERLVVVEPCREVSGTILSKPQAKPDGDYHIRLKLDPGQGDLLNSENRAHQRGALVLEPVCVRRATQRSARATCATYRSGIAIPRRGDHVTVIGPYVHDVENPGHHWMEIHPVWSLELTPPPTGRRR